MRPTFVIYAQVLFVHHYISTMHQLGHTITRGGDPCSGQEGEVHTSSSNGMNDTRDDSSGNDVNRNTISNVDKNNRAESTSTCNSNHDARGLEGAGENCTVTDGNKISNGNNEDSWRAGKGGSKERSQGGQERSSQGDSLRRKFSFSRRGTGDRKYVSAREESTGRISIHTDVSTIINSSLTLRQQNCVKVVTLKERDQLAYESEEISAPRVRPLEPKVGGALSPPQLLYCRSSARFPCRLVIAGVCLLPPRGGFNVKVTRSVIPSFH